MDYDSVSGGLVSSYKKIGESLELENQFFSPITSIKLGEKDITFGNVIYSNVPFSETNTIFTRGEYKDNFDFDTDDYNIRAFQHALIEVGAKKLHILNHHGHHIDAHKLGDDETMRQVKQIVDYIKNLDGAVILCGDFNLSPDSASIKCLNEILVNFQIRSRCRQLTLV